MSKTYEKPPESAQVSLGHEKPLKPAQGHTPGPWRVGKSAGFNIASGVFAKSGYHIAEVVDIESGQAQANARLIASAPDLLAACKAALEYLEGPPFLGSVPAKQAQAAISKAEGRAQ